MRVNIFNTRKYAPNEAYLILDTQDSSPGAHDERVVGSNNSNSIDAFCFKFLVFLDVRREVVDVASRLQRQSCLLFAQIGRTKEKDIQ